MSLQQQQAPEKEQSTRRKSPHAPGQYLGFSLQQTRFLTKLLEAEPGWTVSLEVFEDVGVEMSEGNRIVEQVKSTLEGNPVADRAVDLWKTFSNWIDAIHSGELDVEKTVFEMYVSRPKTGKIVQSFAEATSFEAAQQAFFQARDTIWGSAPDFLLKSKVSEPIQAYVSNVFDADERVVCKMIQAFSFGCGSGRSLDDLRALLSKYFVPSEILDEVLAHALGWIKIQTDSLIEQRKPAIISRDTFQTEITSIVRKLDRRTILMSFAKAPEQEEIEEHLKLSTYVRQLEIIDCDDDEKIRAVKDCLQASTDRTQWSVRGFVHESSFDGFEDGLIRTWRNLKKKTMLSNADDLHKGKSLYVECSLHKAHLEGMEVPDHFTPGSFHALAEKEEIGWHPNYEELLHSERE